MTEQTQIIAALRKKALSLVGEMIDKHLVEYLDFTNEDNGTSFRVLISPDVLQKDTIVLIVSGAPEEAGVWSYTLLSRGRTEEASMESYFRIAQEAGCGMIALNPHGRSKEEGREEYLLQLEAVMHLLDSGQQEKNIILFSFSAGGPVVLEFLNSNPGATEKIKALFLVDTTPPPLTKKMISDDLKKVLSNTVLFGLQNESGEINPWVTVTSSILGLEPVPVNAEIHGEMPSKVQNEVQKSLSEFNN